MTRITQKQLIESLKQLKEIKPRKEWAILLKSKILNPKAQPNLETLNPKIGILDFIGNWNLGFGISRRLAYAFAVVLFLVVGIFGFAQYTVPGDVLFPVKKIAEQSQAALTGQTALKQDVATLNSRINDLSQVAKEGRKDNIPSAISEINTNVSVLAKNLKDNPEQDPQTMKDIAASLKTLASVPGTDLSEFQEIKDLYQIVAQSQIDNLEKTTLAEEQTELLVEIKDLYDQGKYVDALEKILLIDPAE